MQQRLRIGHCLAGFLVVAILGVLPVTAQPSPRVSRHEVGVFYRAARLQQQVDEAMQQAGFRIDPQPLQALNVPSDTLMAWIKQFNPLYAIVEELDDGIVIESWKLIKKSEWLRYQKKFDATLWAYLGNGYLSDLDTTFTKDLRARLEAQYGSPTKTLAEMDFSRNPQMDEYIQFEYWFILNDTIPVIVMDSNGPFDRGLVIASDQKYRSRLYELREAFLGRLTDDEAYAPYVDYYFNFQNRQWYRTGYDGQRFFLEVIVQPNLARGRPSLDLPGG